MTDKTMGITARKNAITRPIENPLKSNLKLTLFEYDKKRMECQEY